MKEASDIFAKRREYYGGYTRCDLIKLFTECLKPKCYSSLLSFIAEKEGVSAEKIIDYLELPLLIMWDEIRFEHTISIMTDLDKQYVVPEHYVCYSFDECPDGYTVPESYTSLLRTAIEKEDTIAVKLLLKYGAKVNIICYTEDNTLLHQIMSKCDVKWGLKPPLRRIIQMFLMAGADPNAKDKFMHMPAEEARIHEIRDVGKAMRKFAENCH